MLRDPRIPRRCKNLGPGVLRKLPDESMLTATAADDKYFQRFASNLIE